MNKWIKQSRSSSGASLRFTPSQKPPISNRKAKTERNRKGSRNLHEQHLVWYWFQEDPWADLWVSERKKENPEPFEWRTVSSSSNGRMKSQPSASANSSKQRRPWMSSARSSFFLSIWKTVRNWKKLQREEEIRGRKQMEVMVANGCYGLL